MKMKSLLRRNRRRGDSFNKMLLISCIAAVSIDPLFSYISAVNASESCLYLDKKLALTLCFLRTLADAFHLLNVFLQSRAVAADEIEVVCGLKSYFLLEIFSILPIPQVVAVVALRARVTPARMRAATILTASQSLLRLARIVPLHNKLTRISMVLTAWYGAASNFFVYILASHFIGSFWYLMSIERTNLCWQTACRLNPNCHPGDLYCGGGNQRQNTFIRSACLPSTPEPVFFYFGMFFDALDIQTQPDFSGRFFFSFVWGLRNLSSLGQNLEISKGIGENLYVIVISITGLILFSFLAGNIQRYLSSLTVRADEMRLKLRDQEQWMSQDMLPEPLRMRVRQHEQMKWQKKRGVDKESLIRDLPKDLRIDIKRHQCQSLLIRVPMFEKLDEMVLGALCCRLRPVIYSAGSYILREGDPIDEMLFIKRGDVLKVSVTCGSGSASRSHSFNTVILKAGDFFGEELLMWALCPNSSSTPLPISTETFKAINDVEAFSLMPDDLKCVLSQFRYRHSDLFLHFYRFYSEEWRLWGACTIQAAWQRYFRKTMGRSLKQVEDSFPRSLPQKPADYDLIAQF